MLLGLHYAWLTIRHTSTPFPFTRELDIYICTVNRETRYFGWQPGFCEAEHIAVWVGKRSTTVLAHLAVQKLHVGCWYGGNWSMMGTLSQSDQDCGSSTSLERGKDDRGGSSGHILFSWPAHKLSSSLVLLTPQIHFSQTANIPLCLSFNSLFDAYQAPNCWW